MKKSVMAILMASSLSLGACATTPDQRAGLEGAGTGAVIGAAAGAGLGAVVGGLSPIQGAAIGAAVGGLGGAIWADRNNDGYADGYVREGTYYPGTPAGYSSTAYNSGATTCPTTLGGAATGAAVGAAGGAVAGAAIGGLSTLAGAAIGAAIGGVAGAVWADHNNDGCIDGYVREGQYYEGAPQPVYQQPVYSTPVRRGERG